MNNYTERQCNNMILGLTGFQILNTGSSYTGNWYTLRLWSTQNVIINGIDLSSLNDYWNTGQYFWGDIKSITVGNQPIVAYNTGQIETLIVE